MREKGQEWVNEWNWKGESERVRI